MGITPKYTDADVHRMLEKSVSRIDKAIFNVLARMGEKCVNEARNFGDYMDQTSNLRSSVGYVVLFNGEIIHGDFRKSGTGLDGSEGISTAQAFASSLASRYPLGYTLIVVAGMNYAAYVETRRNVLSSAEHLEQRELPRMLAELQSKVRQRTMA